MANLVNCKSCDKPVGRGALTCPNCGELHPSIRLGRAFAWLIGACVLFVIVLAFFFGGNRSDDRAQPSEPIAVATTYTDEQLLIARDVFCEAHERFASERAALNPGLNPCFKQGEPDQAGDCTREIELTGKYFGPLPDQIAARLKISRVQAQQVIGWVQARIEAGKLADCVPSIQN